MHGIQELGHDAAGHIFQLTKRKADVKLSHQAASADDDIQS